MNPILSGLLVGVLFGFVLQRGRFCMNSAFRDIILGQDFTLFKALAAAILVEMIGFSILALAGVITLAPKPLMWGANIAGGFIFGIGMVLAGGCASGITYRAGEGMVGALMAILGFGLSALMGVTGVLNPILKTLQDTKIMTADDKALTLANMVGIDLKIAMLGLAILIFVIWGYMEMKNKSAQPANAGQADSLGKAIFKKGWAWLPTGIVVGLIGTLSFPLSAAAGRNYPLGITGGWVNIFQSLIKWQSIVEDKVKITALNWEGAEVLGIVLGALVAALIAGEFAIRAPQPKILLQTFAGGLLMGFGAVVSSGCNIGHILSGVPQLSVGSIVGGVSIILGGWLMAYLMFIRPMQGD
ncbi:MAG TPA: YeeE/YedE family protein [Anaerolineales bacterium]|nr:YeeE/YedE family protein [Anaerolineales bacterium]